MPGVIEPQREVPVIAEAEVCVLGGSCTGVFAAVRAARLGRSVVLVEKTNAFGGTATNAFVCLWHSLYDTERRLRIIGGLTAETLERLKRREAVAWNKDDPKASARFNSEELKIELDELVRENGVRPMLHTLFCAPICDGDTVRAVAVENKDGRGAIVAKAFIDATGDGDLAARCGWPFTVSKHPQAPTTCARVRNFAIEGSDFRSLRERHRESFGLQEDSGWDCAIPGLPEIRMVAQTHVYGVDCSGADDLTRAEMEGRRQIRAILDIIREHGPQGWDVALAGLPAQIGIRETRRFEAVRRLTEGEVLWGRRFDDAIAQGSYVVDVHHPSGGGFCIKHLNGTMTDVRPNGTTTGRWREPVDKDPTFYQIPYTAMIGRRLRNVILAGRMIGTDDGAFGAVRVMVNLNQTGEAAGVAASLAVERGTHVADVDVERLRSELAKGGSIIL
jgi:hypothetical protein